MHRSAWSTSILCVIAAACASTPGGRAHDMSAAQHDREARAHARAAAIEQDRYDPNITEKRTRCPRLTGCWTSVRNPTAEHRRAAEEHRRHAADHRAASAALRGAEARACIGIDDADRDASPFEHVEDIASVAPLTEYVGTGSKAPRVRTGAVVVFRAVPAMTAEWLQRVVDCHLARNAALGHAVPEMPTCPLVPRGVTARVSSTGNGFAVAIRSDDAATAREILARAERLVATP